MSEPIEEREHLMHRPLDWEAASDAEWLDALSRTPRPVDPTFMAHAQNQRPHVLRQSLVLFEQMGGFLGLPARRWLGRGKRQ